MKGEKQIIRGENKDMNIKTASWNVKDVNKEGKREEIMIVYKKELLCTLSETKMIGKRKVYFGSYRGYLNLGLNELGLEKV